MTRLHTLPAFLHGLTSSYRKVLDLSVGSCRPSAWAIVFWLTRYAGDAALVTPIRVDNRRPRAMV
jgi:hypothetical protein